MVTERERVINHLEQFINGSPNDPPYTTIRRRTTVKITTTTTMTTTTMAT